MHPRTQTTRTNHLGYDVGASRKIPDGALARVATVRLFDTDGDGILSMEEISKAWAEEEAHIPTSYWDEVGDGKPNASALKRALADTVLVDAAWLAQLADAGDILPRCQDLPEGARVTLEEMEQWTHEFTVGVLVISYPWLDADHPDKDGLQLRAISHVLKLFDQWAKVRYGAGCKVGVFLDYVSMPQRSRGSAEDDRTPEEKAIFDRSLKAMNRWYGHPKTHVLLVDTDLPAGAHTNMQPYKGRGWCVMECNASGLVKDNLALISLKGLTGEETSLDEVQKNGKAARAPPVAPAPFASTLEAGVNSGATTFTKSGDVPIVAKIYGWAFAAEMGAVVALYYLDLGWDDAQVLTLCEALRAAHAGGGLRRLETLILSGNQMGDGAAAALAALLEEGAMPNLQVLGLGRNQIADDGVAALASALRGGALPACTEIGLNDNQITDDGVAALASALRGGALPACTEIRLYGNRIADDGVAALASALRGGALPVCTEIGLYGNPGSGDPVDEALASSERAAAVAQRQAE